VEKFGFDSKRGEVHGTLEGSWQDRLQGRKPVAAEGKAAANLYS